MAKKKKYQEPVNVGEVQAEGSKESAAEESKSESQVEAQASEAIAEEKPAVKSLSQVPAKYHKFL